MWAAPGEQADDICEAVFVLLSPELRWMTGQRIEVSGGTLLKVSRSRSAKGRRLPQ